MSFAIQFNGLTIDGISEWPEEQAFRLSPDRFPRRQGAIVPEVPFLAERVIRARGVVDKASEAALTAYRDSLAHKLAQGKGQLFLRNDSRYLKAVCTAFIFGYRGAEAPATRGNFSIEWTVGDPYWYDTTLQSAETLNVAASPASFTATNDGTAKTPVRVEIKALSADKTDVKLTNTTIGLMMRYSGTITSGNTLIIDGSRESPSVDNGGTNGFPLFTGSFWMLEPGVNNLVYEGGTGVDVKVFFTKRWE